MDLGDGNEKEKPKIDLNLPVQEPLSGLGFEDSVSLNYVFHQKPKIDLDFLVQESLSGSEFEDFIAFNSGFHQKKTDFGLVDSSDPDNCYGGNIWRMERDPGVEGSNSSSKRRRFSVEEKAKAKIDNRMENQDFEQYPIEEVIGKIDVVYVSSSSSDEPGMLNKELVELNLFVEEHVLPREEAVESDVTSPFFNETEEISRIEPTKKQRCIAKSVAQRLAHPEQHQQGTGIKERATKLSEVDSKLDDSQSPFFLAMEAIKKRNFRKEWGPATNKGPRRNVPKLLDLSLRVLARNADKIVSLEFVPDHLRHRLSQMVCSSGKMDARFVELLARNSPTEIRVRGASNLTEDECTKIFGSCHFKNLTVLQLDLCGLCMTDYVLGDTLALKLNSLPKLATISLRGAHRLSDNGLVLANHYGSTLRELYIDDCQSIHATRILPALKKFKHLEVLSVAGIQTVNDVFVIRIVEAHGMNLKELVFANCERLTDEALKFVGKSCPNLCAIDLSHLHNLTDSALQYLADGCRSIRKLTLRHNDFSDEAIAAFLEVSGKSLNVLSLNHISRVGFNTAESIAKCSRNLLNLDLSWCRKLTNEAIRWIVDCCSSLKELKIFGCTQITDVFVNGHSNSLVNIIGYKMTSILETVDLFRPEEPPLRYSPLLDFAEEKNGDSSHP
ncbi:F-box/LRR-repeat protein 7 isoform X2 [Jatropha curcas]|uniref:F-box/LRR-repeat protein 7 isoform X2 n=1 Tax=Jatropha curcas TaxID=180498 RepID=UPI0009D77032|nr:F-box/LRR-repeat protein 7 isoform X2 [Jatropha curcas]